MFSDHKWYRKPVLIGVWLTWVVSPPVVVENLNMLQDQRWLPNEASHAYMIAYEVVWPIGLIVISIIVLAGLIVVPLLDRNATKSQMEYESQRLLTPSSHSDRAPVT